MNEFLFSKKAEDYHKFRPSYPKEMIDYLLDNIHLKDDGVIADIGSGTGKLSQLLLERNKTVYGVEINQDMREQAENSFRNEKNFFSFAGRSEYTNLSDNSVDCIVAAQAFHWFEPIETKKEFLRILKPNGYVGLIWNMRKTDDDFSLKYDELLKKYFLRYNESSHRDFEYQKIVDFYGNVFEKKIFFYELNFNFESLVGLALSCSYVDKEETRFFQELEYLFTEQNKQGIVSFQYDTELYLGKIKP